VAVFIDGANAYRAFRNAFGSARYAPMRLAGELAAGRPLVRVGFYIAAVPQEMDPQLYAGQQRFLAHLRAEQGLTVWTGRMAQTGGRWYEKGVDVKIATDMVALAYAGELDIHGDRPSSFREITVDLKGEGKSALRFPRRRR
jgi:uncharacterized LabA/DUF88 family protein